MRFEWFDKKRLKWALGALWTFLKREWTSIFVSSGCGILAAGLLRLLLSDKPFAQFYKSQYSPVRSHFDGLPTYSPFIIGLVLAFAIAFSPSIVVSVGRGLRSWFMGVTSGLRLLSFVSSLAIFATYHVSQWDRFLLNLRI